MYTLLSGLWKYVFQKNEYFILILGLDNAGKTTLLERTKINFNSGYTGMGFDKVTTTVGMNIGKVDIGSARLIFWDLGGQLELQSLWDKYYAECHGLIYVVDSSDEARLEESKEAFEKMVTNEGLDSVPLLIVANKQDVDGCLKTNQVKAAFGECAHKIGRRDCVLKPVSALKGDGVNECIEWMAECVERNIRRPPRPKEIS